VVQQIEEDIKQFYYSVNVVSAKQVVAQIQNHSRNKVQFLNYLQLSYSSS